MRRLKSPSLASTATTVTISEGELDAEANETRRQRASADQDSGDVERDFVESLKALEHETKRLEKLMESVIPKHLIGELREAMKAPNTSNFQKSHLEYYERASILFADIVGFTKISSRCKANELVTMLNELFGRFDKAAESRGCLRIKILGDCYYCVSGIGPAGPKDSEQHARQCVETGLDMIDILETLALELRVPREPEAAASQRPADEADDEAKRSLKMRIGIHTGKVVCGIMGKKRWQFDVHSSDVKLANHMEQGGLAGRVHITEVTLRHLAGAYEVEPARGRERDAYIASRDMETYFVIAPPNRRRNSSLYPPAAAHLARSATVGGGPDAGRSLATIVDEAGRTSLAPGGTGDQSARPMMVGGGPARRPQETMVTIDQGSETKTLLLAVAQEVERDSSSSLPPGNHLADGIKPIDADCVSTQSGSDDPHLTRKSKSQQSIQMAPLAGGLTERDLAHSRSQTNNASALAGTAPSSATITPGLARFKRSTRMVINIYTFIRTIDPPFANLDSESTCENNIDKIICDAKAKRAQMNDLTKWTLRFRDAKLERAYARKRGPLGRRLGPLAAEYLGRHSSQLISWALVAIVLLIVAMIILWVAPPGGPQWNHHSLISLAAAAGSLAILVAMISLTVRHVHHAERKSRMDFVYHTIAVQDKRRLMKARECNRSIFFNILPRHVAEHFLRSDRMGRELYSMPYESVGVSFANVTNFETFFLEGEDNDHGKGCLNLLNEIICDFDDLLDHSHFKAIDKIKTIGTTYMTAIGLVPKQEDRDSPPSELELAHQLKVILELIMEMRLCLEDINKNSFGSYRLRAGINVGPVTAGVIGANKPQYDIWGNTVNVASRMESTCEPNKIQITREVRNLLARYFEQDCEFVSRGEIDIKGKGLMETFYVDMPRYRSLKDRT